MMQHTMIPIMINKNVIILFKKFQFISAVRSILELVVLVDLTLSSLSCVAGLFDGDGVVGLVVGYIVVGLIVGVLEGSTLGFEVFQLVILYRNLQEQKQNILQYHCLIPLHSPMSIDDK